MGKITKCALVTGASRGIGKGIALVLAEAGYDVAITYSTKEDDAKDTAAKIEKFGRRAFYYQASLEKDGVAEETVAKAVKDLGRIDILVNNAGVTMNQPVLRTNNEMIDYLFGLNYRAPIIMTREVAQHMVDNKIEGSIIQIASTHAFRAYSYDTMYGGLKAALTRSTESLALDLIQYGIRVNCIAPGATSIRGTYSHEELTGNYAPKIPSGRYGSPKEIGKVVLFLASKAADYIIGVTIKVDGGLILPGMPEDARPEAGYGWSRNRRRFIDKTTVNDEGYTDQD